MPRPGTKEALVQAATEQFTKLWKLIDSMTEEEQNATFLFEGRDRNIRDILIHLYEWHQLLLAWVPANQKGKARAFLPEPYNWRTYPRMNVKFWEKHQDTPYQDARVMLQKSHADVMELIGQFTNTELFARKHFPWTDNSTLGNYCVSNTSSHYVWAITNIKKHIKSYRAGKKA